MSRIYLQLILCTLSDYLIICLCRSLEKNRPEIKNLDNSGETSLDARIRTIWVYHAAKVPWECDRVSVDHEMSFIFSESYDQELADFDFQSVFFQSG